MTIKDLLLNNGDPFSDEQLESIFKLHPVDSSRLQEKEANNIEYKKTFHFESFDDHARTFAAFANANGGYFVFGVDDESRELIGLKDNRFDRLDPKKPTEYLNQKFAPAVRWKSYLHVIDNKQFGLIYIYPSLSKPVIALQDGTRFIEGQILYRYNGTTQTIKYAELRQLMESIRATEKELWLRHLRRLAAIGVDNAAVFDFEDGTAHGKSGAFIIDADLLSQIQFLREGEFVEKVGTPAIRIVGEAEIVAAGISAKKPSKLSAMALTEMDVQEIFLKQREPEAPKEFIKVMLSFNSFYTPIYYFAHLAEMNIFDLESFVKDFPTVTNMLKRIHRDVSHERYYQLPKTSNARKSRQKYIELIEQQKLDLDDEYDPIVVFQAIQLLSSDQIDQNYLLPVLHQLFEKHWSRSGHIRSHMRKAICHIDYEIFRPKLDEEKLFDD